MHAIVVDVDIVDLDTAIGGLQRIVPAVAQAPGFIAAYWIRLGDDHATSVAVFETEEQATAARPPAGGGAPGVRMMGVTIGEVLASA